MTDSGELSTMAESAGVSTMAESGELSTMVLSPLVSSMAGSAGVSTMAKSAGVNTTAESGTENTKEKSTTENKQNSVTLKKKKKKKKKKEEAMRRVCENMALWVWKKLQMAMWVFFGIGMTLCLLLFTFLLQPTSNVEKTIKQLNGTNKGPVKVNFTQTTFLAEDAVEVEFTISKVNATWGLGFDIRDQSNDQRAIYIWLYHDIGKEQEISPDVKIHMWITCKEELEAIPNYFEEPWQGGWNMETTNDIKIMLTRSTLTVHNVKNETHEEVTCWTHYKRLRIQVECWTLSDKCPRLQRNQKAYPFHYMLTLGVNVGSITVMGFVLGFLLATAWIRLVNINLFYLLPLWKTSTCNDSSL